MKIIRILLITAFVAPIFGFSQTTQGEIQFDETINLHKRIPPEREQFKEMISRNDEMVLQLNALKQEKFDLGKQLEQERNTLNEKYEGSQATLAEVAHEKEQIVRALEHLTTNQNQWEAKQEKLNNQLEVINAELLAERTAKEQLSTDLHQQQKELTEQAQNWKTEIASLRTAQSNKSDYQANAEAEKAKLMEEWQNKYIDLERRKQQAEQRLQLLEAERSRVSERAERKAAEAKELELKYNKLLQDSQKSGSQRYSEQTLLIKSKNHKIGQLTATAEDLRNKLIDLAQINEALRKEINQQHHKIREHNINYARLLENNNDLISELLQVKLKKGQLQ